MDRETWKRDAKRAKPHKELHRPGEALRGDRRGTNVMPSPFLGLLSTIGNYTHDVVGHNNMTFL